ncbi:MAG: hypothetical protein ABSF43_09770 [Rectinemataceae bacterium]|jgi:hypothetical protein
MSDSVDAFLSTSEAIEALAQFGNTFVFPNVALAAEAIALKSLESVSMKSLIRKCPGGADICRRWVIEGVSRMVKSTRYVINQEQFDRLVRRTGMDLLRSWRDGFPSSHVRLSFGAAFRAVDLLFMAINESKTCRSGLIQSFLHVPLDRVTLRPLRLCIDELVDRDFAIVIPAAVPTDFVATEEQYVLLQETIFALAEKAGVPPITYAYYCASISSS